MVVSSIFALRLSWVYRAPYASYKDSIHAAPDKTHECHPFQDTIQDASPNIPLISAQTTTQMLMLMLAYIWYGLMCASAMLYHCFHPRRFSRNMDVLVVHYSPLCLSFLRCQLGKNIKGVPNIPVCMPCVRPTCLSFLY